MPAKAEQPSVRFWYSHTGSATSLIYQKWLSLLPHAQQDYYQAIKHCRRRKQFISSRLLICSALSQLFKKPLNYWQIEERNNSTPVIHNLPEPHFLSLTHSHNIVCFALSSKRIGIDAELLNGDRDFHAAAEFFMNTEELDLLPESGDASVQYFYRLWCAKEAFYKALPIADQDKTTLTSLSYSDLERGKTEWQLFKTQIDSYQIAVVTQGPKAIDDMLLIDTDLTRI